MPRPDLGSSSLAHTLPVVTIILYTHPIPLLFGPATDGGPPEYISEELPDHLLEAIASSNLPTP
jgi:hypothetical protein